MVREPYGGDRNISLLQGTYGLRANVVDIIRFALGIRPWTNSPLFTAYPASAALWLGTMWAGLNYPSPVGPGNYGYGLTTRLGGSAYNWAGHRGLIPGTHSSFRVYDSAFATNHLQGATFAYAFNRTNGRSGIRGYISAATGNSSAPSIPTLDSQLHTALVSPGVPVVAALLSASDLFPGYD